MNLLEMSELVLVIPLNHQDLLQYLLEILN